MELQKSDGNIVFTLLSQISSPVSICVCARLLQSGVVVHLRLAWPVLIHLRVMDPQPMHFRCFWALLIITTMELSPAHNRVVATKFKWNRKHIKFICLPFRKPWTFPYQCPTTCLLSFIAGFNRLHSLILRAKFINGFDMSHTAIANNFIYNSNSFLLP